MSKTNTKPKRHISKYLKLMIKWMGKYGFLLIPILLILLTESYLRTIVPLFGQHIIDVVLAEDIEASKLPLVIANLLIVDSIWQQLLLAAGMIVFTALIRSILIFLRRFMTGHYAEKITYGLRNKLYKKLQDADYSFYAHAETGDLIQRCTTDVEMYKRFISEQVIEIGRLVFLVGFSIYQMSRLNLDMTLISLIVAPVLFIIAIFYFRKVEKMFHVIEDNEAKMTTHVQENVSGARVVKAFANERYEVDKFDRLSRTFTDSDFNLIKKMSVFWSVTDLLSFVQFFVIAIVGVIYASNTTITLGMYTAFLAYAGNIIWPMRQLGRLVGDFSKAIVSVSRLDKIISNPGEYEDEQGKQTPDIKGAIKFDHVSFKFPDGQNDQIVDIDFNVNQGETVAIIGKTGSGKSTLINLLVRLLDYQKGHIYVDGTEITDIEKHHLRRNVGFILQEPFLFSRSVEENIKIADKSSSQERVEQVARIAQVHEDIKNFEMGYETLVGERGVTLSGGQKQRVAIARMLINPKPILVFDDSLSAVDTVTDIQIRRALKKEWKDSTVFIITHRITTAAEADRIIVIEDGRIIESGTHKSLVEKKGSYNRIWEIQSKIDFRLK